MKQSHDLQTIKLRMKPLEKNKFAHRSVVAQLYDPSNLLLPPLAPLSPAASRLVHLTAPSQFYHSHPIRQKKQTQSCLDRIGARDLS